MSNRRGFLFGWLLAIALVYLSVPGNAGAQTITITGEVRDAATNNPIAGVLVKAMEVNFGFKCSTGASGHHPTTDLNGQYALVCAPGKYKIHFGPTAAYVAQWYNAAPNFSSASWVGVPAGSVANVNANLSAAGGGQITGQVTEPGGAPIQNARILVYDESFSCEALAWPWNSTHWPQIYWPYLAHWIFPYCDDHLTLTHSDSAGNYTISNLAPGSYKIFFYVWMTNHLNEWWNDKTSFGSATTVSLTAGGQATANAELAIGGKIVGTVTDGLGNPLQNAFIEVYDQKQKLKGNVYSLANGAYELNRLPSGEYLVRFRGPDGTDWAYEWFDNKPAFSIAQTVKVNAGNTATVVNVQLETGWTVAGTVNPDLSGARITVYDSRQNRVTSQISGTNGHYQIRGLPNGDYKILFDAAGYGLQWYNNRRTWETADALPIRGGGVANINAGLGLEGRLETNVSTAFGPLPKAKVKFYDAAVEQLILASVTNSWGDAFLERLPPMDGKVYYDSSGTCFQPEWWFNQGDFATAGLVSVVANGTTFMIDELGQGHCVRLPLVFRP